MCVKVVNTGQEILSVKSTVEFYNGEKFMKEYLENVRCVAPLIHNITNYVTANDVANVLFGMRGKSDHGR